MKETVKVSLDYILDEENLEKIRTAKNINFEIQVEPFQDILNEEQTKKLLEVAYIIWQNGCNCVFGKGYSIQQAVEASRRLNSWVDEIKSAQIYGQHLTNYEKYLYAYEIVTDFVYNEEKEWQDAKLSRHVVNVLTSDKIVCVGYSSLLKQMLDRLNIPCAYVYLDNKNEDNSGHLACAVYMEDEKYGMANIIFSDPTFGSRKKEQPKDFHYSTMSYESAKNMWEKIYNLEFDEKELLNSLSYAKCDIDFKYLKDPVFVSQVQKNFDIAKTAFMEELQRQPYKYEYKENGRYAERACCACFRQYFKELVASQHENRPPNFSNLVLKEEWNDLFKFCSNAGQVLHIVEQNYLESHREFEQIFIEMEYLSQLFVPDDLRKIIASTGELACAKVFEAQGLSFDAASDIAAARFHGKTVGEILKEKGRFAALSPKFRRTEKELKNFAEKKKDYSKRETKVQTASRENESLIVPYI